MKAKTVRRRSALGILYFLMIAVTAAFVSIFFLPGLVWRLSAFRQLEVWAVDKTVPYPDYREHAGLFWILKYEKIAKSGSKQLYNEKSDYFGFYPYGKDEWRGMPLPASGTRPDLIYITDTYGVYKDDYMQRRLTGEWSPKLYGGLSAEDINTIRKNLGEGNTFIAEFNTAASPTNQFDRDTLGRLLGVEWSGWIGRYFVDLSVGNEVPAWVIESYETQHKKPWNFFGRGYVIFSDRDEIEVLSLGKDVGMGGMSFSFKDKWKDEFKLKKPVSYRYWFEWTNPRPGTDVVAEFEFDLSAEGRAKFEALGLPVRFPAVYLSENTQYTGWYFAGDFAEINKPATPFRLKGIGWVKRVLADDSVDNNDFFFWKAYVPLMQKILKDAAAAKTQRAAAQAGVGEPEFRVKAFGKGFQMKDKAGLWRDFFVRGVNMGLAEPGKYFTQFPQDLNTYLRWFDAIADMNANTVRVYTLPPPELYQALYLHNIQKPDKTLYLLQELWPEEHPENGDYLAREYRESFLKEIDYGIDAIYGRANVPERKGRAWGIYTVDVSPWLLGWLVGRELESEEVLATDARNKGTTYTGRYVSAGPKASPTEAWLAESLDEVASIEAARYGKLHPVAIVSWPTLDPREHDSEWDPATGKKNKGNDRASVAIDHFEISAEMKAGLFGAYHIYPNYPDFINNEVAYGSYMDEKGLLRYGGYLKEFMESHRRYPALVAEFGMANGAGIAHFAPDGLHHGGIDEATAGEEILRMLAAIEREGYAGGVVFEWMDEWVKKTWTTETLMIPYDRHVLWHNVVDPEQNYGLMANEVIKPEAPGAVVAGNGAIKSIEIKADASYLHLDIEVAETVDFSKRELLVALDTLNRNSGQTRWPVGGLVFGSGMEFLVRISAPDKADLLVIPSYNAASSRYATQVYSDGRFERMSMLVNGAVTTRDGRKIPEKRFDASALPKGDFDEAGELWNIDGTFIRLRLPWTLINVSDPSSGMVLQDERTGYLGTDRDTLRITKTDGFLVEALLWDAKAAAVQGKLTMFREKPFSWKGWEEAPPYRERFKKSYYILQYAWAQDGEREKILKKLP